MRPSGILLSFCALTSLSSAWPWPPSLPDLRALAGVDIGLNRRAPANNGNGQKNHNNHNNHNTKHVTAKPGSHSKSPSKTSGHDTSGHGSKTTGKHEPTTTKIPFSAFPGGVNLLQPATTSGSQYYRVGTTVTWVFNYTSLLATPSHIDIVATMSASSAGDLAPSPFTLAVNQSFSKTQTFTWDTGEYFTKTSRLPVGTYTLQIFDGDAPGGSSARPKPGMLAPYNQFYFGMYTPTAYLAPAKEFQCITCNAAGGNMARLTWGFLVGMLAITMTTFFWFTGSAGVLF